MSPEDAKLAAARLREALERRGRLRIPDITVGASAPDKKAEKEAAALATGDLEKQAVKNEHDRTEKFRDHVATGVIWVFWIAFVCMVAAGLIWFWHLVTPETYHPLSQQQVEKIGNLLFGGVVSTFISSYAKKRLN